MSYSSINEGEIYAKHGFNFAVHDNDLHAPDRASALRLQAEQFMTDAELQSWWPELGTLVAELRQIGQALVAESMLDALSGSTSGEILGDLGLLMRKHRTLRAQLSDIAMQAWDTIMADINKNYPVARLVEWIARMTNR